MLTLLPTILPHPPITSKTMHMNKLLIYLFFTLTVLEVNASGTTAPPDDFQRMTLWKGTYQFSNAVNIPAFCLDRYSNPPFDNNFYHAGTPNITVTRWRSDSRTRQTVSLNEALRSWIHITGAKSLNTHRQNGANSNFAAHNMIRARKQTSDDQYTYEINIATNNGIIGQSASNLLNNYSRTIDLTSFLDSVKVLYYRYPMADNSELRQSFAWEINMIIWLAIAEPVEHDALLSQLRQTTAFLVIKKQFDRAFGASHPIAIRFAKNYNFENYRMDALRKTSEMLIPGFIRRLIPLDQRIHIPAQLPAPTNEQTALLQNISGIPIPPNARKLLLATADPDGPTPPVTFNSFADFFDYIRAPCCTIDLCLASTPAISGTLNCDEGSLELGLSGEGLSITLSMEHDNISYSMNLLGNAPTTVSPLRSDSTITYKRLTKRMLGDSLIYQRSFDLNPEEFTDIYKKTTTRQNNCEVTGKICIIFGKHLPKPYTSIEMSCDGNTLSISTMGKMSLSATNGNVSRSVELVSGDQNGCDQ